MGKRLEGREEGRAYVVDAGGRTGQSYRGLKKVPRVLPPPGRMWVMYGRCRDGSSLHAPPPPPTREEGAHARMAMSDSRFPIPDIRVSCRCQSPAARVSVGAGSSAGLWRVRLARRRVSSVVVQVNCSEASRVGDGTRREAAVTARRDSWRVSRSTAVEIPMGRGRLGGELGGGRSRGSAFTDVTWWRLQKCHFHFHCMLWKCPLRAAQCTGSGAVQPTAAGRPLGKSEPGNAGASSCSRLSAVLAPAAPRRVARWVFFFPASRRAVGSCLDAGGDDH